MNAFRFNFDDDDKGFELVDTETATEVNADKNKEPPQSTEDEVIWETEED